MKKLGKIIGIYNIGVITYNTNRAERARKINQWIETSIERTNKQREAQTSSSDESQVVCIARNHNWYEQ